MDIDGVTIDDSTLPSAPLVFIVRDEARQPLEGVSIDLFVGGEQFPSITGETNADGVCILNRPATLGWAKLELYALRDDPAGGLSEVLELVGDRWVSASVFAQQVSGGGVTVDYHLAFFQPCGLDDVIDEIDTRLTAAEADIAALETGTAALGTRVAAAETNITGVGTRLTTVETTLTALNGRMTAVEGNIAALQAADVKIADDAKKYTDALETKLQKQIDDLKRELVTVRNIVRRGAVPHGDLL